MAQVLFIDCEREGYEPSQVGETWTLGELVDVLKSIERREGCDMKVYFRHDNGYTYGGFTEWTLNVEDCDDVEEEDDDEDEEE